MELASEDRASPDARIDGPETTAIEPEERLAPLGGKTRGARVPGNDERSGVVREPVRAVPVHLIQARSLPSIAGRAIPAAVGVFLFPIPPAVAARAWLTPASVANAAFTCLVTTALVSISAWVAAVAAIHVGLVTVLHAVKAPVDRAYPIRSAHTRNAIVLVVTRLGYPARIAVAAAVGLSFPDIGVECAVVAFQRDTVACRRAVERLVRAVCIVQALNLLSIAVTETRSGRRRRRCYILVEGSCWLADVVRTRVAIVPHVIRVALEDASPVVTHDDLTVAFVLASRYFEQLDLADTFEAGHLTASRVHVVRQCAVRCGSALRRRLVGGRRRTVRASEPERRGDERHESGGRTSTSIHRPSY
ncbi:hypothetical protein [Sorangium sp. So ce388]|uniref:hypothetical protein n=1 Tax=Sorangium sp. So ce388 TaxID=3133309 RepID=UPI003F5B4EF2